jgi:glycosyltransferase involved in cell wall biosynthesis
LIFGHSSNSEGAERTLFEIINELCKSNNNEIILVLPNNHGALFSYYKNLNIRIILMNYNWVLQAIGKKQTIFAALKILFWKLSFQIKINRIFMNKNNLMNTDVVITNTSVIPWGGILARKYGFPHIWMIREDISPDGTMQAISNSYDIYKEINDLSDFVLYPSKHVKIKLDSRIRVMSDILYSSPKFMENELKSTYKYSKGIHRIAWVGSLTTQKDPLKLIIIAEALKKLRQDFEIHVFGVGELKETLIKEISDQKLENSLIYRGHTQNLAAEMKFFDFSISTATNEAFGRSLVESCEFGVIPIYPFDSSWEERFKESECGIAYINIGDISSKVGTMIQSKELINLKNKVIRAFNNNFSLEQPHVTLDRVVNRVRKPN